MSTSFPGKVALVTGGGAGIGLCVARQLKQRGATVVVLDADPDVAAGAAAAHGFEAVVADVRHRRTMASTVRKIAERHGRLDVVVANAGVSPRPGTIRTGDPDDFDRVIDVNLHGVVNTVRPALDPLIATGGHAVLVASAAAFTATPCGAAYAASKAAVEAIGRSLRLELAPHGVSVQVAYFGIVETEMTRSTLDDTALGADLGSMLPWPLNRRISADEAATSLVGGIERRAARSMAPEAWTSYSLLRGAVNVGADAMAARNAKLHHIVRAVEDGVL